MLSHTIIYKDNTIVTNNDYMKVFIERLVGIWNPTDGEQDYYAEMKKITKYWKQTHTKNGMLVFINPNNAHVGFTFE